MGTKRVTSKEVAQRAGVSRTTVSLVLNNVQGVQISDETRQRVLDSAKALGYVPNAAAKALASRRSQIIGIVLTRDPHHIASDAFLNQIINGLIASVHKNDMRLLIDIVETRHQKKAYLELIRAKRIDGMILSGPRFDDEALMELERDGFPTVLMGQLPGSNFHCVDVDNRAAAFQAVEHLIHHGHRRIACITNASLNYTAAADRLIGYRQALAAAGIPYDESLIRYGDFDPQSGYDQMKSLLEQNGAFTGAFVASDVVALGAMAAIRQGGRHIPNDIALVSFDDVPLARYLDPHLTTIRLPASELACKAFEILIELIRGHSPSMKQVLLETNLIERASCGGDLSRQVKPEISQKSSDVNQPKGGDRTS